MLAIPRFIHAVLVLPGGRRVHAERVSACAVELHRRNRVPGAAVVALEIDRLTTAVGTDVSLDRCVPIVHDCGRAQTSYDLPPDTDVRNAARGPDPQAGAV